MEKVREKSIKVSFSLMVSQLDNAIKKHNLWLERVRLFFDLKPNNWSWILLLQLKPFVVQAASNKGPSPYTMVSYSHSAMGVAACTTDRTCTATLVLGNREKLSGVGLSGKTLAFALGPDFQS
ncbi:Subtilisin-like protease SBT2.4 [Camellia lanceoleosa]|uniref:Subtilisin-like protease SBT2.4 n=1 Tax=Camellia lanceoleosa TaxID=1840588 RepID=A0ACC0F750_9ERIC|nr:Subtilisin-like protease SBT2.4 [Camellia lanceoleosa]